MDISERGLMWINYIWSSWLISFSTIVFVTGRMAVMLVYLTAALYCPSHNNIRAHQVFALPFCNQLQRSPI